MTYRLRFSRQALDDLAGIGDYVLRESQSVAVADGFVDRLTARCENRASLRGTLGRDRSELRPGMRSVAYKSYVIFFHYRDEVFEVVSVIEGHGDIVSYFGEYQGPL